MSPCAVDADLALLGDAGGAQSRESPRSSASFSSVAPVISTNFMRFVVDRKDGTCPRRGYHNPSLASI